MFLHQSRVHLGSLREQRLTILTVKGMCRTNLHGVGAINNRERHITFLTNFWPCLVTNDNDFVLNIKEAHSMC